MGQFVGHDVVDKVRRKHHHTPVEAQCTFEGAATPPSALIANEYPRPRSSAQPGPPAIDAGVQTFGGPGPVPPDEGAANCLLAPIALQAVRNSDAEAPVVEADLGTGHGRRYHGHAEVSAQVRQSFAADESKRCGLQHRVCYMPEDPARPLLNDCPQLAVRRPSGRSDAHACSVHGDLDRLPASSRATHLVLDRSVPKVDAVPFDRLAPPPGWTHAPAAIGEGLPTSPEATPTGSLRGGPVLSGPPTLGAHLDRPRWPRTAPLGGWSLP